MRLSYGITVGAAGFDFAVGLSAGNGVTEELESVGAGDGCGDITVLNVLTWFGPLREDGCVC